MNGYENILANDGIGIAITGMSIVFVALVLVSVYIALLPRVLKHLARILPVTEPHYRRAEDETVTDEEFMIAAAIAMTLRRRRKLEEQAQ